MTDIIKYDVWTYVEELIKKDFSPKIYKENATPKTDVGN